MSRPKWELLKMHVRFEDKTLLDECRRQPDATTEELAKQLGVSEKRILRLRDRVRRTDNPKSYFISNEQNKVKIGKSVDPRKRLKALQSDNADQLTLLGICDHEEGELHTLFADDHVRGEWFELSDEIKNWIQEHAQMLDQPLPSRRTP